MNEESLMIKIDKSKPNYDELIDAVFKIFNFDGELAEIRKQQILSHPYVDDVVGCLVRLSGMLGQIDNESNRLYIKMLNERLVELHSPVQFDLPVWSESAIFGAYEWKELSFEEIYDMYIQLCEEKQWEWYYGYMEGIHFWTIPLKNYQIVDMLNDLIVDKQILEYDVRSFMKFTNSLLPEVEDDELLADFDKECVIAVKILKK